MQIKESKPYISVIIPCYNEEKNLERKVLEEVHQHLVEQDYVWEVIVVNDESTDNSRSLVKRFTDKTANFSLHDIPHGGKPAAVWGGIQKARGEIVLFTDMDQSTPISELDKLTLWYAQGFDVVIGSRGTAREGFAVIRQVGSAVFRGLRRLFLLRDISDTQCGFKSCRRDVALQIFPHLQFFKREEKPTGWKVSAYDVELLYLFEKAGYSIKEIEVRWQNRDESDTKDQTGEMTRYFKESFDMAKEVVRVKRNQVQGFYDEI
ncbi:MAG: glycosyltransferase [Chloroflexi bacterium]|nr:glycosyltransferase [Chloroflexota bacterium]